MALVVIQPGIPTAAGNMSGIGSAISMTTAAAAAGAATRGGDRLRKAGRETPL